MKKNTYWFLLFIPCFIACKKEPPPPPPTGAFEHGVFVINEGLYNQTSGTISFYNPDSQSSQQDIFKWVNERDLGNVVQSMTLHNDRAYIVVNNSNKIEVVQSNTFEQVVQITGLAQPRYFLPIADSLALLSQWGLDGLTGTVLVLDLAENTVRQTIATRPGAETMLLHGNKVFLACTGGYGNDNVVQVIDVESMNYSIEKNITVADYPNSLALGADGNIWVACAGKTVYTTYPNIDTSQSTAPALVAINPNDGSIAQHLPMEKGFAVLDLISNTDGSRLYFSHRNQVWELNPATLSRTSLFSGDFYGLGFSTAEQRIYAARNAGIEQAWVLRFSTSGVLQDSFRAGVFANGFVFR